MAVLISRFKKTKNPNKTKYENFYSNSIAKIIINESGIDDVFQSISITIITKIKKSLGKGSGWILIQSLVIPSVFQNTIL